ncbi:MAG TPA: Gfo/Idh/MocA family oxidoreductase [Solirubrobacteraceae bacterium]
MGVSWGIISTANINTPVIAAARASQMLDIVAVAGRDEARTASYAREHGIPRAHTGYDALLADPDVEAVYISLPNGMHVDWAVRALQAGKHVLCEKPLSRRVAEAERAFDAADAAGRLLMEAFMWRHNPQTQRFAQLAGEAIGELRLVRAAFSFPLTDPGNVRLSRELDGGALMDVGCYCVSGARLLAGEPDAVSAQQVTTADGVDVRLAATLRHAGGVLTTLDCALDLPNRSELQAIGSGGVLSAHDPWHCRAASFELLRGEEGETVSVNPADSYRLELENLSAAIRGEGAPLLGREDAVAQARVIEALYASADAGGALTAV